jgi:membrane peptidoglycan carboxypeptidase
MAEQKYITQQQADEAKKVDVLAEIPSVPRTYANVTAPFFVKYVEAQLDQKYGNQVVDSGGLKVITTIDLDKQKAAEEAVAKNMKNVNALGGTNAALVAEDPKTGQVKAWVGGSDFSKSQVDVANAQRQPGSSFKPFVYSTLFNKQDVTYGPGTTIYDVTTDFGGGYTPHNYCLCNYGVVSVRQALGNSLNIPAVKVLYMAGIGPSIQTAHNLGISTLTDDPGHYGLSLVLGSGEVKLADMVAAYSGFATAGTHVPQQTVLKITDSKGKTLEDNSKPPTPKKVLDPQAVYELNSILSDNGARTLTFGANFSPLIIPGKTTAVKTGTTENFRDAWTIGYTQSTVGGVWTGNNDGHSMSGSSGAVAAPIWHDFMVAAIKDEPNQPFVQPAGIKNVTIDAITGRAATDKSKQTRSDIFAAWYKPTPATDAKSAKIDKLSNKLATPCTPPLAVDTIYSSAIQAEIAPTDSAFPRWNSAVQALAAKLGYQQGASLPTENDDRHSCSDSKPTVNLTVTGNGPLHIKANYTSGTFTTSKLEFKFDDQVISTQSPIASNPYSFDYDAPSTGSHTITATVTDDGYYQAQDTSTVSVTHAGGETISAITPTDGGHASPPSTTLKWTDLSNANNYIVYYRNGAGAYTSTSTSANFKTISIIAGIYSWYVEAYGSGSSLIATSPVFTFTSP